MQSLYSQSPRPVAMANCLAKEKQCRDAPPLPQFVIRHVDGGLFHNLYLRHTYAASSNTKAWRRANA